MSKDKLQKIWNEIKITYAKIQEIYSAPQISSTHQYLSLTPITNADEDNVYSDMLRFALSQNKTNNMAEPYRVCRRPTFLRECSDEKTQIYP